MIIPDKTHKEWREVLEGDIEISFSNFFFQSKINQLKDLLKNEEISIENAVVDLHALCTKLVDEPQTEKDILAIFDKKEPVSQDILNEEIKNRHTDVNAESKDLKEKIKEINEEAERQRIMLEKAIREQKTVKDLIEEKKLQEKSKSAEQLKNERLKRAEKERKRIEEIRMNEKRIKINSTETSAIEEPKEIDRQQNILHETISQKNESKNTDNKTKLKPKKTIKSFLMSIFDID